MKKQRVDTMGRTINTLNQQIMANKDEAITTVANELFGKGKWKREGLRGHIYKNGVEIYQYNGLNFIELAPIKFSSKKDGDTFKVEATQSFRRLEPTSQ